MLPLLRFALMTMNVGIMYKFVCVQGTNLEDRYIKFNASMLTTTYQTLTAESQIVCCAACSLSSECTSVNYKKSTEECQLSTVPLVSINNDSLPSVDWRIYTKQKVWTLVFRGTPGNGVDVYYAWVSGISVTTDDVTCKSLYVTSCTQHYRDPIVNSWDSLSISKVKYSMYRDGNEVAYVTFNGTGSNITNWFSQSRVLESTWLDVATETCNYFSIWGHSPGRHFFINRNYGGCPADLGYTVTVVSDNHSCTFDNQTTYPQFFYANSTTYVSTNAMIEFVIADLMTIHVMG